MCGHMRACQEPRKRGYGRMVKFLLAKEKMRVRFPLSAHDEVMYYDKRSNQKFDIVLNTNTILILSTRGVSIVVLPYSFFWSRPKRVINY